MATVDAIVTGLAAAGGTLAAVAAFGWKARDWLQREFDGQRAATSASRAAFHNLLDAHEAMDNQRHIENLERFSNLNVTLATKGYRVHKSS